MRTTLSLLMILLGSQVYSLNAASTPSHVEIIWDAKQPACNSPLVLSQELSSKSLIIRAEDLAADKAAGRFIANCRLQGRILLPKGYALADDIVTKAQFSARELSRGDRVAVQTRVSIANLSAMSSDSLESVSRPEAREDESLLKTELAIPSVEACEATETFKISFSNKVLINSRTDTKTRLNASFDQLLISPLRLVPAQCPPKPDSSTDADEVE